MSRPTRIRKSFPQRADERRVRVRCRSVGNADPLQCGSPSAVRIADWKVAGNTVQELIEFVGVCLCMPRSRVVGGFGIAVVRRPDNCWIFHFDLSSDCWASAAARNRFIARSCNILTASTDRSIVSAISRPVSPASRNSITSALIHWELHQQRVDRLEIGRVRDDIFRRVAASISSSWSNR